MAVLQDFIPNVRPLDRLAVEPRLDAIRGSVGVAVLHDESLRQRYGGRRLVALFEPRSLTAGRSFLFDAYVDAFAVADRVHFAPTFHAGRLSDEERLDLPALAGRLQERGVTATVHASIDALIDFALAEATAGDVLVTMSSGSFGGAPLRLAAAVETLDSR